MQTIINSNNRKLKLWEFECWANKPYYEQDHSIIAAHSHLSMHYECMTDTNHFTPPQGSLLAVNHDMLECKEHLSYWS